jgi:hypothetical protein
MIGMTCSTLPVSIALLLIPTSRGTWFPWTALGGQSDAQEVAVGLRDLSTLFPKRAETVHLVTGSCRGSYPVGHTGVPVVGRSQGRNARAEEGNLQPGVQVSCGCSVLWSEGVAATESLSRARSSARRVKQLRLPQGERAGTKWRSSLGRLEQAELLKSKQTGPSRPRQVRSHLDSCKHAPVPCPKQVFSEPSSASRAGRAKRVRLL